MNSSTAAWIEAAIETAAQEGRSVVGVLCQWEQENIEAGKEERSSSLFDAIQQCERHIQRGNADYTGLVS